MEAVDKRIPAYGGLPSASDNLWTRLPLFEQPAADRLTCPAEPSSRTRYRRTAVFMTPGEGQALCEIRNMRRAAARHSRREKRMLSPLGTPCAYPLSTRCGRIKRCAALRPAACRLMHAQPARAVVEKLPPYSRAAAVLSRNSVQEGWKRMMEAGNMGSISPSRA